MTLIEHLYELRNRLAIALVAVAVTSIFAYIWYGVGFFGGPNLGDLIKAPYCALPSTPVITTGTSTNTCSLFGIGAFDQLSLRLRVAMTVGVVLACPVWLYQIWAFVTPALYAKERRYALTFVGAATALFLAGAVLAYYIVPQSLEFLLGVGGDVQVTLLSGVSYFNLIITLIIIFGVSFELPLIVVMLNRAGVLTYAVLRKSRRGIIFGLFVFAAIATPSQDPLSMSALAVALTVLCELSIQIARHHDRRKAAARQAEGWDSWNPDEPSPIDTAPSPVDTAPSSIDPVNDAT